MKKKIKKGKSLLEAYGHIANIHIYELNMAYMNDMDDMPKYFEDIKKKKKK